MNKENIKILFVYSLDETQSALKPLSSPEQINFGISYIAGLLKKNGHVPNLVILCKGRQKKSFILLEQNINEFKPDIISFHIVSTQYDYLSEVASYIKERNQNIFLLAGGPHVSINPDDVITGSFDAICIGEGEYPTLELVQKLIQNEPITNIANFWIRTRNGIEKNATRPFIENLDSLSLPYRNMWFRWIEEHIGSRFSILLGRGCYFNCTYCSNHVLRRVANGDYVRFRSPDNIISELRDLHHKFPNKYEYFFEIEAFNINKKWMIDLCLKLKTFNESLVKPLVFGTNIRITPNSNFEDIFASCAKANIRYLTVGLESGSERIRRDVMNRVYSNDDVIRMASQARKYGLKFGFQNMIGLPSETEEDFMETVNLNRICQPDWYNLSIFYPYPGTDLANTSEKMGLLNKKIDSHMERKRVHLDLSTFPERSLKKRFFMFELDVYKGKKPFIKILAVILQRILSSYKVSNNIYRTIMRMAVLQKIKRIVER